MSESPALEWKLVQRLQKADEDAYAELYDRYAGMLLGMIMRFVSEQSDAENLLQDCFVKIWRHIDTYDSSKGRLSTWVMNIARNTAIDFTRSRAYQNPVKSLEQLEKGVPGPVQAALNVDAIGLRELLNKMPQGQQEMLYLAYFEGYTQQEIADRLQMPLGTVKARTRQALQALRRIFESS